MKSEKMYKQADLLSGIRDEWIDEALNSGNKPCNHQTFSLKRLAGIAAACVAATLMVTTCIINAAEISSKIRSLFTRESELIDPYAVVVDNDVGASDVSMTISKVFLDGDCYYFYLSFHDPYGFDSDIICYEKMTVYEVDDNGRKREVFKNYGETDPYKAVLAAQNIVGKLTSDTDFEAVVVFNDAVNSGHPKLKEGKYSFVVDGLMSAGSFTTDSGSIESNKKPLRHADKLSADFEVDGRGLPPLPMKTLELNTEFELDGYMLTLERIVISPMSIEAVVSDKQHQTIEIGSQRFGVLNLISYFSTAANEYNALLEKTEEEYQDIYTFLHEHNAFQMNYKMVINLADGAKKFWNDTNYRYNLTPKGFDENGYCCSLSIRAMFSGPIYEDELISIEFQRDIADENLSDDKAKPVPIEIWKNE